MTFYWWSHWFWITLLSNVLLSATIVHTYPSQEIKLEYNQSSGGTKMVTKLYQSTTTLTWVTAAPSSSSPIMDLTEDVKAEKMAAISVEDENVDTDDDDDEVEIEDTDAEALSNEHNNKNEIPIENFEETEATAMIKTKENSEEYEYKRSAENINNKTNKDIEQQTASRNDTHTGSAIKISKKPTVTITEDDSTALITEHEELAINNSGHNNFSGNISKLSTNSTQTNITTAALDADESPRKSLLPPSAPQIDTETAAAEWLHTAVALPENAEDYTSNLVTTSSNKVPFTLENANKEDELRRAESEHRSRKSKVLSAEYKHINRYINYSADPKSLLTRSASAAPNEFENDSEGNISSEALAVQRTYFLDAGTISAICFTIFGVCCTVGTIGIVLYRRRYLNKPQTLSEPDSSVYIDDSTMRVSDNSDEMYSLDNDSFLNSLEAMTIQNYWTDTVKHTKL